MRKPYNIKWRPSDLRRLTNIAKRFNAKLTRTVKKIPEAQYYLPERLNTATIRQTVKTRQDFNALLNSYERFLAPGAENPYVGKSGLITTYWQKREVGIRVGVINRRRARELKAANPSTLKGTMGTITENNLRPKKYNIDEILPSNWDKFLESVRKQSAASYSFDKMQLLKENYLKSVDAVFGGAPYANYLHELLDNLPPDLFTDAMYDNAYLDIDFVYDEHDMDMVFEKLIAEWNKYLAS